MTGILLLAVSILVAVAALISARAHIPAGRIRRLGQGAAILTTAAVINALNLWAGLGRIDEGLLVAFGLGLAAAIVILAGSSVFLLVRRRLGARQIPQAAVRPAPTWDIPVFAAMACIALAVSMWLLLERNLPMRPEYLVAVVALLFAAIGAVIGAMRIAARSRRMFALNLAIVLAGAFAAFLIWSIRSHGALFSGVIAFLVLLILTAFFVGLLTGGLFALIKRRRGSQPPRRRPDFPWDILVTGTATASLLTIAAIEP